jgi:hypothetical protein
MFLPAWCRYEPTGDPIAVQGAVMLNPCGDLRTAKRVAEAAAGMPLRWEACRALRALNSNVIRARGPCDGEDGWYIISRSH